MRVRRLLFQPWSHGQHRGDSILLALFALLLATSACGGSTATTPRATASPTAAPARSAVYVASSNQTSNGTMSTTVEALDSSQGTLLWQQPVSGQFLDSALASGRFYLGSVQNTQGTSTTATLEALDATTGTALWKKTQTAQVSAPLAATADAVFVNSTTVPTSPTSPALGSIEALRGSDGSLLWSTSLAGSTGTQATLGDGVLYLTTVAAATATSTAWTLLALNSSDGKTLWHLPLPSQLSAVVVLSLQNGVLYLAGQYSQGTGAGASQSSLILAYQASNGASLWRAMPPEAAAVNSLVTTGSIAAYSYQSLNGPGGGIVALRSADGSGAWQVSTSVGGPVPLAASNGVIWSGVQNKSASGLGLALVAYEASSAKLLFSRPLPTLSSPYVGFQSGSLFQAAGGAVDMALSGPTGPAATPGTGPQFTSVVLSLSGSNGSQLWQHQLDGMAISLLVSA